jgi:uncharacterized protein YbjT (DUF2867 family)
VEVAVVGGTGALGRLTVASLTARGQRPGRALRAGALRSERPDHRGTKTFAQWLG